MDPEEIFIRRLCEDFPKLRSILTDHLQVNRGRVIPFVFLADLNAFLLAAYERRLSGGPMLEDELRRLFDFFETRWRTEGDDVKNLIEVGLLEGLGGPPEPNWRIRELLGPWLRYRIEVNWPSGQTQVNPGPVRSGGP